MSKYKFDLAPAVKTTVEWVLGRYHEDKRELERYKTDLIPSATASYSVSSGTSKGGTSNPTESVGIRMVTSPYIFWTERNCTAVERVLSMLDDTDKELIDLVYWKRTYGIVGAGAKVGLGKTDAYKHINNILGLLALEMGIVNI